MFAVIRYEFPYQLVYLLHIATVVVAFAAGFVHPRIGRLAASLPGDAGGHVNRALVQGSTMIHFPALVLAGLFGSALVAMSDGIYEFSDSWISFAFLVWFVMLGIFFFLVIPAQRALAADPADGDAGKKFAMSGGIIHLLFLVMLVLMIWKPGSIVS